MASNVQKIPLQRSLNQFAERKVYDVIAQTGKALPCRVVAVSGSIVTVAFAVGGPWTLPQVTVPMFGPEYIRYPTQVGDLGVVFPADTPLGGITGLGGSAPVLPTIAGNLSALVFFPVASKNWSATEDPNALVLYGPDGAILRDSQSRIKLKIQATTAELDLPVGVSFVINGNVVINGGLGLSGNITGAAGGTYAGNLATSGNIIAGFGTGNQVGVQTHTHTQAADSHGDTEAATAAPTAGT